MYGLLVRLRQNASPGPPRGVLSLRSGVGQWSVALRQRLRQIECLRLFLPYGQGDAKGSALAYGALHVNAAVVLLHDAVGQRQPEPRALPDGFRRVERIENPRQMVFGNPSADNILNRSSA